jgi:hypothetical protein
MYAGRARGAPAESVKRAAAADIFLSLQEHVVLDFSGPNAERGEASELQVPGRDASGDAAEVGGETKTY